MKIKTLLDLILLLALCLGFQQAETGSTGSAAPVADTLPAPAAGAPKFAELIRAITNIDGSPGRGIDCGKLFNSDSPYVCLETYEQAGIVPIYKDEKVFRLVIQNNTQKDQVLSIELIPAADSSTLDRLRQGLTFQRDLKVPDVIPIEGILSFPDFLAVVYQKNMRAVRDFPDILRSDLSMPSVRTEGAECLSLVLGLLQRLHKTNHVSINPKFYSFLRRSGQLEYFLGNLQWVVPTGEAVGAVPFDPLLTDPVALKDPAFKADAALDYYALGIHIFCGILRFHRYQSTDYQMNELLGMKEKGEFVFPVGANRHLVLLAAFLLQDDRNLRGSLAILEEIVVAFQHNHEEKLDSVAVFRTSTNPMDLPELQPLAELISELRIRLQGSATPTSTVWAAKEKGLLDSNRFLWIGLAVAGGLLVLLALYFLLRPRAQEESVSAEVKKNLNETAAEDIELPK